MEVEDSSSPRWSPSASVPPSHTSNHVAFLNHNMPRRYIGDGMDFRRPVTSDVIDLTEDDTEPAQEPPQEARHRARRQPRFGRNIMDVIDLEAEETQAPPPPLSPEIQFVSSRPISPARRPNRPTYEIRDEDENEVEFVSENRRARPMMRTHDEIVRDLHRRDQRHRETEAMMNQFLQRALPPRAPPRARRGGVHTGFMPPHRMQYAMAAFDLGYLHDEEDILPPAPTYNAPAEAPEGFTRSPQEEGALICPNCEDELCVGESERKKQVWIVKSCGHVCYVLLHFVW
jgi:hypothetical protein